MVVQRPHCCAEIQEESGASIMSEERRKYQRIRVKLETLLEMGRGVRIQGTCENLSAKGVYFVCHPQPPVGGMGFFVIRLGDERYYPAIRVQGKIVRKDERGVGIEFIGLDFRDFEHLKNTIVFSADDPEAAEAEFQKYIELYRISATDPF